MGCLTGDFQTEKQRRGFIEEIAPELMRTGNGERSAC